MAGFVVRKIEKTLKCVECRIVFSDNFNTFNLIQRKNRGGLKAASNEINTLCKFAERTFRIFQAAEKLQKKNIMQNLITHTFMEIRPNIFETLNSHILEQDPIENHKFY